MEALETFVVESPILSEAQTYKSIVSDVISELVLGGAIGRIKVIVTPEDSLFQMAIVLRASQPLVKMSDIADVDSGSSLKKEVAISINEEKYLPELLEKLWARYGRGNIRQPERKTLIIKTDAATEEAISLKEMVIADPKRTLQSRLVEMAIRATPEGFRVRYHSMAEHSFVFVASEDTLKPEWISEAHKILDELQEEK
ncbi:methanogenesis marker 17 protein [Methanolobus sp. ZRKC3]|uniref:methanogenesis marker 17 protein n=1 Tax=Methanolobus sp. ZRKC3 TaxID=3125786 RepID=UPI0032436B4F